DPSHQCLELPAPGTRHERDRRSLERGVAHLDDSLIRNVGNEADASRRGLLQMAAEASRQIEHRRVVELDAVLAEDDRKARAVRPFGLRALVAVVLEKIEAALGVEHDALEAVFESPHRVHAARSQQLAEQIDESGSADAFRRAAPDDAEPE